MEKEISKCDNISGELILPSDKSITHRAIILGSLCDGDVKVFNPLLAEDTISTMNAMRTLGVNIEENGDHLLIHGVGLNGLSPKDFSPVIDCGNSGTTMRLLSGILAGFRFKCTLTGDESLRNRPMARITDPLSILGADIESNEGKAPLNINFNRPLIPPKRNPLIGGDIKIYVSSAQVKSAILFTGMYSDSKVSVTEPHKSRDHSERMLEYLGALTMVSGNQVTIFPCDSLEARDIYVPRDISSSAYFMAAAALKKHGSLTFPGVNINPTRSGIIDVLNKMGASIEIRNERDISNEPVADITVSGSELNGVTIEGEQIPLLIDELPIIAVMGALAHGETIVRDAKELRNKESDRIKLIVSNLRNMGALAEEYEDGFRIIGGMPLKGCEIETNKDHRIAMAFSIAALFAEGQTTIKDAECVNISYPDFYEDLKTCTSH